MFYQITEKLAYSKAGKAIATVLRDRFYPNCRVHWVQQSIAELNFKKLG